MKNDSMSISVGSRRIESIDILRGVIMIIMALDHSRDYFHDLALTGNPLNPDTTTPILFFTRWITHFCAPTFVFLAGLSAYLQGVRKSKKELSLFLVTRGLWLIVFDLIVMSLVLTADTGYGLFLLETLWSIGISMFILGLLIWLPYEIILTIGLIIVFGHNLLDFVENPQNNTHLWWNLLHRPGIVPVSEHHSLFVLYPFLSWTGLMLLGYCIGKLFTDFDEPRRKKILLSIGFGAIAIFIFLRSINVYGNPQHWSVQKTWLTTMYSFMNVLKYPPSLLYICITIGPMLVALALIKNTTSRLGRIISVYGRVPLFYFMTHLFILHIVQIITYFLRGHTYTEGIKGVPGNPIKFEMTGDGYSLFVVYLIWIAVIIIMYPLCKWYDRYKSLHKEKWWLSYL
jgi:uncharacterized membrane protein